MKGTFKIFRNVLGDIDELEISEDSTGIVRIKGIAITCGAIYKITIKRNDPKDPDSGTSKPPMYLYSGTISLIDPETNRVMVSEIRRRKREEKGGTYTAKDCYASKIFRFNKSEPIDLATKIREEIDDLYDENKDQFQASVKYTIQPDQVTPQFAANNYADEFLLTAYPQSRHNDRRKRSILNIFSMLPCVPFRHMKKREVTAIMQTNHITEENITLCRLFVDHLINHNKIEGANPFPSDIYRDLSCDTLEKRAFTNSELTKEVFEKLFLLMNQKASTVYCGIALLTSGFLASDVLSLKWSDIEFIPKYTDFAVVHIRRDQLIVAKHDFSRPAIPDAALYLHKVYKKLCKENDPETVKTWHIVTTERSRNKPLSTNELSEEANNLLVRAGYSGRLSKAGRPEADTEPIPIRLLTTNYRRMLKCDAGLSNDADTFSFLAGLLLRSSTYTNYLSYTSDEAQYRLYKILKSVSTEKTLRTRCPEQTTEEGKLYQVQPRTTHEVAQLRGSIELEPGQYITLCVPSGLTGPIDVTYK